ncbi:methyltransferase [Streptomyces sp. NPDC088725]|uniref:methyltransferase n=1 Tax=Streptomyces sp. NPDC088725 TaxID=3365873 RepID=UPI0038062F5D
MLHMLDVREGHRVLEIGTGTGWNAGLLAHRLGGDRVTTMEVDPALTLRAASSLGNAGLGPRVITGNGAGGYAADAPYDRIVATCSVREVPPAWVAQTRPGGVILTPGASPWCCFGLLRLTVDSDSDSDGGKSDGTHTASGRFSPHASFMLMREQRTDLRIYRDVVRDEHVPEESGTELNPEAVAGDDWAARFAVGPQLTDVWHTWHDNPDVPGVASRLWIAATDAGSWAAIDKDGRSDGRFTVWQYGPRRLWDEMTAAYLWWQRHGSPGPERFGLTVPPSGRQTAWLDSPTHPVPRQPGHPRRQ